MSVDEASAEPQEVYYHPDGPYIRRLAVPGGWLYITRAGAGGHPVTTFVPYPKAAENNEKSAYLATTHIETVTTFYPVRLTVEVSQKAIGALQQGRSVLLLPPGCGGGEESPPGA